MVSEPRIVNRPQAILHQFQSVPQRDVATALKPAIARNDLDRD